MENALRIGFDAKRLFNNFTGLGNYSRTLVRNLLAFFPEHEYHLFTPKFHANEETNFFIHHPALEVHQPKGTFKNWWRLSGIKKDLQKAEVEVYHGLSHEIPLGIQQLNIKTIVTIHDLIFKHYPKQFHPLDRRIYDYKFKYACTHSDLIVAISESTKADIVHFYNIPPEKIEVIYQTCHERFKIKLEQQLIQDTITKYQLPNDFLLYVGSVIPRKNLGSIIEALHQIPYAERLPVVVIGKGDAYLKRCQQLISKYGLNDLFFFPNIEFHELPRLYQAARVFLYPSIYEGFGIPIIEALYSDCAVLTSDLSSLPEAGGNAAHLVDPTDVEAIAAGIQRLVYDEAYRKQLLKAAPAHLEQFEPERLTHQLMELYKKSK